MVRDQVREFQSSPLSDSKVPFVYVCNVQSICSCICSTVCCSTYALVHVLICLCIRLPVYVSVPMRMVLSQVQTILKPMASFMEDLTNTTFGQYRSLSSQHSTYSLVLFVCSVARCASSPPFRLGPRLLRRC